MVLSYGEKERVMFLLENFVIIIQETQVLPDGSNMILQVWEKPKVECRP